MEKRERQRLKVAELVQVTQAQPVAAGQTPPQDQVDQRRMIERYSPDSYEVPEFILDFNFAGQAVP